MSTEPNFELEEEGGFKPSRIKDDAEMDITPMIDVVFLMLIYFLVCSTTQAQLPVKLPPATYGTAVSDVMSLTFIVQHQEGGDPKVWQEGRAPFSMDPEQQAAQITRAVEEAKMNGIFEVLVKVDKELKQKHLEHVRAAISEVEDIKLYMAVDDHKK
ncbi:MAG: biopolymer transporter ExbD [Planctomycetia bacterium]|nr:biopolymer transporter ExbD [Planctomycetia bacterium]